MFPELSLNPNAPLFFSGIDFFGGTLATMTAPVGPFAGAPDTLAESSVDALALAPLTPSLSLVNTQLLFQTFSFDGVAAWGSNLIRMRLRADDGCGGAVCPI